MSVDSGQQRSGHPRFEYYPPRSPTLRTVPIDELPFTIGRGEEADLQISSTSVSREHAQLDVAAGRYVLRDLGSTNGTSVNGQAITEVKLSDGDLVRIADIDLTFVVNAMGRLQRMVTQPLSDNAKPKPVDPLANEITAIRSLGESLLWQITPLEWVSIVEQRSGREIARTCSLAESLVDLVQTVESERTDSTSVRLQRIAWQHAIENYNLPSIDVCLHLRVESQTAFNPTLIDAVENLSTLRLASQTLGLVLPWEWATHNPASIDLCAQLQRSGLRLAFDSFSGGAGCVEAMRTALPELLILSIEVVRGVASQPRVRQRLETVKASCDEAGVQAVMPLGCDSQDVRTCAELGIHLIECYPAPTPSPSRITSEALV